MKTIQLRHIIMLLFFSGFMVNTLLNEYVYVKKQEHLFTHAVWKILNVDKGYCKKRILSTELEVEEDDQFVDDYLEKYGVESSNRFMQLFDAKAFDILTPLENESEEVRSQDNEQREVQECVKHIDGTSYPHDNEHSTSSLPKETDITAEKTSEPKEMIIKSTKRRKRRRKRKIYSKERKKGKRRKKEHDSDSSSEQDYNLFDGCGSPIPFHYYPTRYKLKKEKNFVEETKFVNTHENVGTNFDLVKHEESNIDSDIDYSDQIQSIILSLEDSNNIYNNNISGDTLKDHHLGEHAYATSSSASCGHNELDMDGNEQSKISTADSSTGTSQSISFSRNNNAQSIIEASGSSIGSSLSNVFDENNNGNFIYQSPGINNPFELLMNDNNELVSSFIISHDNIWQPAGFWGHYNEDFIDSFANSSLTVLQPTEIVENDIRSPLENSTLSELKPSIFTDDSDDFLNALREESINWFENTGLVGDGSNDFLSSTAGSSKGILQTSGLIDMRNNEQENSDVGSSTEISHPAGLHGNANDDSENSYVYSSTDI
ncbi:Plasmodium exported protein, unknown function [Plasmodium ovale]|uniref:Uncharacterized protein n=1 Tax=Plasmodium ovale TaxID=36330 RepID=A0A1D3TLZ9_PLAOA|nr:Plasmodium exported protein, unknown function [Plasmodium ovale]